MIQSFIEKNIDEKKLMSGETVGERKHQNQKSEILFTQNDLNKQISNSSNSGISIFQKQSDHEMSQFDKDV